MKKCLKLFLLSCLFLVPNSIAKPSPNIFSEKGISFVKNYSPEEFNAQGQNWSIVQDSNGFMYFGNTDGIVLQYDGVSWRHIPIANGSIVRSLAIDSSGIIFIGAQNDFGFLENDEIGNYQFVSLLPQIDSSFYNFGNVWQIYAVGDYVYFSTHKFIFRRSRDGKFKVWKSTSVFHTTFYIRGKGLFVHERNIGLKVLDNDSLKLIPGGGLFKDDLVYAVLPAPYNRLLVGARNSGLFLYDGIKFTKFNTFADDWLIKNQIYSAIQLRDSTYFIGTLRDGIIHLGMNGDVLNKFNKALGLQDDNIWSLFQDKAGSIWVGLNKGISRINYPSAFSFFDERLGLEGNVQDIVRFKSKLYAATGLGIYVLQPAENLFDGPKFELIPGLKSQFWSLLPFGNRLLVSCNHGVFELINNEFRQITRKSAWKLEQSILDTNRIFLGLDAGISSIYKTESGWSDEDKYPGFESEARTVEQDSLGNLWIGTVYEGVSKIKIKDYNTKKIDATYFNLQNGLPSKNYNLVFENRNDILFGTTHGIFRFDNLQQLFSPLILKNQTKFYEPDTVSFTMVHVDKNKNIWFNRNNRPVKAFYQNNSYHTDEQSFLNLPKFSIYSFYSEENGIVWFGGTKGIIRYEDNFKLNNQYFKTHVRKVLTNNDSIIFAGNDNFSNVELPAGTNSLRFEFASTDFTDESANLYQYRLQDFEKDWSVWTNEHKKDYTNIPFGKYTFEVRGKNIYGITSNKTTFE